MQCLRALAALLVLGAHLAHYEHRAAADAVLPAWLYLGGSGVDLFFVISGFVMVYVTRGGFGRPRTAAIFLYNRAARIYPPVWLFTALTVAGVYAAGTADQWLEGRSLLFSFLLLPHAEGPILGVAWTLVHELYFYLAFGLFLLGPARLLPLWLLLWAGLIVLGEIAGWRDLGPRARLVLHPLTLEFIMGCVAGLLACSGRRRFAGPALAVGTALFFAGWPILAPLGPDGFPQEWGRTLIFGPAAALIVYGIASLEADTHWRAPRAGIALGDWSYALYLSHALAMSALAQLWAPFALTGTVWDNLAWIAVTVPACLILAAIVYYGFERPMLALAARGRRALFGGEPAPPRAAPAPRIW